MESILLKGNMFRSINIYSIGRSIFSVFQYRSLAVNRDLSLICVSNGCNFGKPRSFSTKKRRVFYRSPGNSRLLYLNSRYEHKKSSYRGGFQIFMFFATCKLLFNVSCNRVYFYTLLC